MQPLKISGPIKMPPSSLAMGSTQTCIRENGERGLFARGSICKNEAVVAFGGTAVSAEYVFALPPERRRFALQISDDAYLYSDRDGPGDWVNHSCDPNVGLRGQVILVAMRDIRAGEEICFDYAMTDLSDYDAFDCQCYARKCRGRVSGEDWRIPSLQLAYRGYFAPHVEQCIRLSRPK